jgi:uncharacterized protein involved in exopolysaccharide biosynthesis
MSANVGTKRSFWHARQRDSQEADNMEAPVGIEPRRPPRRLRAFLALALFGALGGFLISYLLPARYTSTSTVLVGGQKVPDQYVQPVITADFAQRVLILSQEILAPAKLRPVVHSLNLVKPEEEGKLIGQIQQTLHIDPIMTLMSAAAAATAQNSPTTDTKTPSASVEPLPGFNVEYTDSDPLRAQKICDALTSLIVDENLKSRSDVAQSTIDFLSRQLEDAKRTVDGQDAKLAAFKKQYMGQLPTDIDSNMGMLMSLNTQLDATTQTLARAQQDKTYAEGMLAQQIAAWKSSLPAENPQTLQQANSEPPEIREARLQIHQYQNVIDQATQDQKKLQASINVYQARTAMSPNIEEEYKTLVRDNDTAEAFYRDLLAKKFSAQLSVNMETQQLGEQMYIAATANLPEAPEFPIRPLLALWGLSVALLLGIGRLLWPAARRVSQRLALLFPIDTEIE